MKILKYRTIAVVYPFLSLEAMVELDDGSIVYTNMNVNNRGKAEICTEDSHWTYNKPLTEVDLENVENSYYELKEDDDRNICEALTKLWNSNPIFVNDIEWKDYLTI